MGVKVIDKGKTIDVLFINEGTYPYVRGGVATWVHQLITGMPDLNFGILFLGSREEDYGDIRYELPENVVYLENYYMYSEHTLPLPIARKGKDEVYLLGEFFEDRLPPDELVDYNYYHKRVKLDDFLYGKKSWFFLEDLYLKKGLRLPFVEYFWSMKNMLIPLWRLSEALNNILKKPIRLVHSPTTGYAGFLGAMLKKTRSLPFIITEHGIYVKERKIDIISAYLEKSSKFLDKKYDIDDLQKLWIQFFINVGRIDYLKADRVYSLYEGARLMEIQLGCPPEKTEVIPNGVNVDFLKQFRKKPGDSIPKIVALIGRVTPIKDIKTFIKAMKVLTDRHPDAEGWVVGPEDEDPQYAEECRSLVKALGLEGKVKFLGFQRLPDILPKVGLVTLTSISEGMPMVVLEAFGAGLPCVTTDVGSCSQLIYGGLNEEDKRLGAAGKVCDVGDFRCLASAYEEFLYNEKLWWKASEVAVKRVERFYRFDQFISNYRRVYETYMLKKIGGRKPWPAFLSNLKS